MFCVAPEVCNQIDVNQWTQLTDLGKDYYDRMIVDIITRLGREHSRALDGRVIPVDASALLFDEFDIDTTIG